MQIDTLVVVEDADAESVDELIKMEEKQAREEHLRVIQNKKQELKNEFLKMISEKHEKKKLMKQKDNDRSSAQSSFELPCLSEIYDQLIDENKHREHRISQIREVERIMKLKTSSLEVRSYLNRLR